MSRFVVWGVCALAGCGRVGYAPVGGSEADPDGGDTGGADADVPAQEVLTLGEAPGTDVSGVTFDTLVNDADAGANYGATDYLDAGTGEAGLIRFDVTAVPSGAEVLGASLQLWLYEVPGTSGQVSVFEVLEAWQEGTQDGAPGVANWNERLPGVPWTDSGVGPGSRASEPIFTFAPQEVRAYEVPLPPALVQGWVRSPDENFGLLFTGSGYSMEFSAHPHFDTSDTDVAERRPVLTIEFAP